MIVIHVSICPGTLVKFNWWSSYRAETLALDHDGNFIWEEIKPEETGLVINIDDYETALVFMSKGKIFAKIHLSMLAAIDDGPDCIKDNSDTL